MNDNLINMLSSGDYKTRRLSITIINNNQETCISFLKSITNDIDVFDICWDGKFNIENKYKIRQYYHSCIDNYAKYFIEINDIVCGSFKFYYK